jgi:S-adenosylmethionine synthetase
MTSGTINTETIARNTVRDIGYDCEDLRFCHDSFEYLSRIHGQSPDISQGVTAGEGLYAEQGAGDQGMMFGYATNETPEMLPVPIAFSHRLLRRFEQLRREKIIDYLQPDAKAQVSVHYDNGQPQCITSVVVSHQTGHVSLERIRKDATDVIRQELDPSGLLDDQTRYFVNPTGSFILGGPFADAGLTGRKIIVDTYGGVGSHGGGAFSGKDPSKVDRSAAYFARYAAKNIVGRRSGGTNAKSRWPMPSVWPRRCPSMSTLAAPAGLTSVRFRACWKTATCSTSGPAAIIDQLQLLAPEGWNYEQTASYGHFGRDRFPWEKTDKGGCPQTGVQKDQSRLIVSTNRARNDFYATIPMAGTRRFLSYQDRVQTRPQNPAFRSATFLRPESATGG